MKRWTLCGLVACLSMSGPVKAADTNAFLELLPELRSAPAPDWVRSGTRLTYWSGAATIPADRALHYRDDQGDWYDQQGNKYRADEISGRGGAGLTEVDIAAMQPDAVALAVRSLGYTNGHGPVVPLGWAASVGLPGVGGDYWLSPAVLQRLKPSNRDGLLILPMPYPLNGQTYDAVRFHSTRNGNEAVWVFDRATGILLYSSTVTAGELSGGLTRDGKPGTSRMLTCNIFKGVRKLNLPWMAYGATPLPEPAHRLRYQGTLTVTMPGSPTLPLPAASEMVVTEQGPNWLRFAQTDTVGSVSTGMPPNVKQFDRVSGPGQIGGLWLPPQGLAGLQANQTIDRDPISGAETTVVGTQTGPTGRQLVIIREAGQAFGNEYYYDLETGILLAMAYQDGVLNYLAQMELASAE